MACRLLSSFAHPPPWHQRAHSWLSQDECHPRKERLQKPLVPKTKTTRWRKTVKGVECCALKKKKRLWYYSEQGTEGASCLCPLERGDVNIKEDTARSSWWAQYRWGCPIGEIWDMMGLSGNMLHSCFKSQKRPSRPISTSPFRWRNEGPETWSILTSSQGKFTAQLPSAHRPLSFYHLWSRRSHIISSHPALSPTPRTWRPCSGQLQPRGHRSKAGQSGAWFFSPRGQKAPPPRLPQRSTLPQPLSVPGRPRLHQAI